MQEEVGDNNIVRSFSIFIRYYEVCKTMQDEISGVTICHEWERVGT
jgi:hypothetical protein